MPGLFYGLGLPCRDAVVHNGEVNHHHAMTTKKALADLASIEAALYRMRCHLNSMAAADARMVHQAATCRRLAGDAMALLEEATDA